MAKRARYGMKVALDIGMCLVLVLLYKAKVLTLDFHEIAGLAIFGLFALHLAFNWKWVVRQGKKLFDPATPARTKFSYWLSITLLVSFVLIVVSGIFISKILFKDAITALGIDTSPWRTVHLFFSAVALILVGIHVGLYWDPVRSFFRSRLKMPAGVAKVAGRVALVLVLGMGVYALGTTSFGAWLASPVVPMEHGGHGGKAQSSSTEASDATTESTTESNETQDSGTADSSVEASSGQSSEESGASSGTENGRGHGGSSEGDDAQETSSANASEAADASSSANGKSGHDGSNGNVSSSNDASAAPSSSEKAGHGSSDGSGSASGESGSSDSGSSNGKSKSGNHGVEITPESIALTIADFTSIIALFAALTWWIDHRLQRRKKTGAHR